MIVMDDVIKIIRHYKLKNIQIAYFHSFIVSQDVKVIHLRVDVYS